MTVAKIVELVGESQESWEDAVRKAVGKHRKPFVTLVGGGTQLDGRVNEDGEIVNYKADVQIAFAVEGTD